MKRQSSNTEPHYRISLGFYVALAVVVFFTLSCFGLAFMQVYYPKTFGKMDNPILFSLPGAIVGYLSGHIAVKIIKTIESW